MIHVRFLTAALGVSVLCGVAALTCKRSAGALDTQGSVPEPSTSPARAPTPPAAVLAGSTLPPLSPNASTEDERNTIQVFRETAASAVFVTQRVVLDFRMGGATEVAAGSGSGFVWDTQGHIVTNYHVVGGVAGRLGAGASLTVTLHDQTVLKAEIRGVEELKDIAVLKVDAPPGKLVPIRLHDPRNFKLQVGQKAIAIGNPFGLDHTLTVGIVSALGRSVEGARGVEIRDMVQTDAAINPGNSGGPLLDSGGRLIGMNTAIFSKSGTSAGVGFAVPSSTIQRVVPQIIRTGKAEQVGLGIEVLPDHYVQGIRGVIIVGIRPGTPAAQAGLQSARRTRDGIILGDVIVGIDQYSIEDFDDLYNTLDTYQAGQRVTLKVRRGRELLEIPIELVRIQ